MRCPTCHGPSNPTTSNPWRPFCCERCRLIDLGEWISEGHRISDPDDSASVDDDGGSETRH